MKTYNLIKWHKRLAWIAGITFILWACTGILHPVMTWTNPRPVKMVTPITPTVPAPNITATLKKYNIAEITGLRQTGTNGFSISIPNQSERLYFINGKKINHADEARAKILAQYYTGRKDIRSAELITEFSNSYTYINRYLPVWKVTFNTPDKLTAYVETDTDRLAAITNTRKIILQTIFQTVHTLNFLDNIEFLRVAIIFLSVGTVLAMLGMGIAFRIFLKRPRGASGARFWHRFLALIAWIPFLCFPASGLFHVVMQSPLIQSNLIQSHIEYTPQTIKTADLPAPPRGPQKDLRLVILPDHSAIWHTANDNDEKLSLRLAGLIDKTAPPDHATKTTTYSNEYGFAFKRLPVWRVPMPGGNLLFIEPQTAILAARTTPLGIAETWSFSTLHKWQFMNPALSTMQRDYLMIAIVLIGIATALSGILILIKRR